MPKITYLNKLATGTYYFRKIVPLEYQHVYGKVIKISLRTKDRMVAEQRLWKLALEWAEKLGKSPKPSESIAPHVEDALTVFQQLFHLNIDYKIISADYIEGMRKKKYSSHIHPDAVGHVDVIIDELKKPFLGQEYDSEKVHKLLHLIPWASNSSVGSSFQSNATDKGRAVRLGDILAKWSKFKKYRDTDKTYKAWENAFELFKQSQGNLLIGEITADHVLAYRDWLQERFPEHKAKTINTKLEAINSLLSFSVSEGYIKAQPLFGRKIKLPENDSRSYEPFDVEDLKALFFTKAFPYRHSAEAWAPLIAFHTGARVGEICQLQIQDIKSEDGIHYFDINENDEGKNIKTKSSKRQVPIHKNLIELGLLEYVKSLNKKPTDFIFNFKAYRNNRAHYYSRRFGEYKKQCGIISEHKVFHSFRTGFIRLCDKFDIPEHVSESLVGHATPTIHRGYKGAVSLAKKNEAIQKLVMPIDIVQVWRRWSLKNG